MKWWALFTFPRILTLVWGVVKKRYILCTAPLRLSFYFASMQEASAGAMLAVNDDVRPEQVVFLPQDDIQSVVQTRSVDV